jgi:hypothetical protein
MGFAASNEMVGLGESDTDETVDVGVEKTPEAEEAPENNEPDAATD